MLLHQVKAVAHRLGASQSYVIQVALEQFVEREQNSDALRGDQRRIVNRGDVYWLQRDAIGGAEPDIRHPYVVIQEDVLNHSRLNTVVVCALTSNLKRASFPGSVLLDVGEANLPKPSVIEVSKVSTVGKAQLGDYIGSLSEPRVSQIIAGMRFLQASYFDR